jgi:hypothetical protein
LAELWGPWSSQRNRGRNDNKLKKRRKEGRKNKREGERSKEEEPK